MKLFYVSQVHKCYDVASRKQQWRRPAYQSFIRLYVYTVMGSVEHRATDRLKKTINGWLKCEDTIVDFECNIVHEQYVKGCFC